MDNIKNKTLYIIVAIIGILILVYLIVSTKDIIEGFNKKEQEEVITVNNIKDNMFVGIWREKSETDIDLYSKGEDNLYLGAKPYQYIITPKGNIYEYQDKIFTNDDAILTYFRKMTDNDFKDLQKELDIIFEKYNSTEEKEEIEQGSGWIIHFNNKEIRVKYEVVKPLLDKYLSEIEIKASL